ncbi:hypothetical protein SDC9_204688 [bioreactor metagenome]|uniref:Uncharacterized protein n=1 Tax=bioreactor metagenome TaxID=1076179 RepID=A0A645J937_9ZZZZ
MRGIGVEVLLGQTHFVQILACGRVHQDGVGRREVVGGDVVGQYGQWAHAAQSALGGQRTFPVGRAADIGALRPPVIQCPDLFAQVCVDGKHGFIDRAELLWSYGSLGHCVDFHVAGPDVPETDFAALEDSQHIVLDIEADGACNRIGHDQRR